MINIQQSLFEKFKANLLTGGVFAETLSKDEIAYVNAYKASTGDNNVAVFQPPGLSIAAFDTSLSFYSFLNYYLSLNSPITPVEQ